MKSQVEALQCKLSAKEEVLKMKEDAWKTKEEAWKYLETTLKSNNIKTEIQEPLPKLIGDAIIQTDSVLCVAEACQTQQLARIDCAVQANLHPENTTLSTQTIKVEPEEIAMPNLPSSSSSGNASDKTGNSSNKTSSQKTNDDSDYQETIEVVDRSPALEDEFNRYEWRGRRSVRDDKISYTSLKILGSKGEKIEIKRGDHIMIENVDNVNKPHVGKVNRFYEDLDKNKRVLVSEW